MTTPRLISDPLRRRPPAHALGWVRAAVGAGSRIVSVRPLPSSWLANHAITVADRHDYYHWLVLRRWARPGWDLEDPTTPPSGPLGVVVIIAPWPCASRATHRLRRWSALGDDPVRSGLAGLTGFGLEKGTRWRHSARAARHPATFCPPRWPICCRSHLQTVSRWAKQGNLPFMKTLGGHRRYPEAEIRELVNQLRQEPTA